MKQTSKFDYDVVPGEEVTVEAEFTAIAPLAVFVVPSDITLNTEVPGKKWSFTVPGSCNEETLHCIGAYDFLPSAPDNAKVQFFLTGSEESTETFTGPSIRKGEQSKEMRFRCP